MINGSCFLGYPCTLVIHYHIVQSLNEAWVVEFNNDSQTMSSLGHFIAFWTTEVIQSRDEAWAVEFVKQWPPNNEAPTLFLAFVTNVSNVVRKVCYRNVLLDCLPLWATLVLRGKLGVNIWHHFAGHIEISPSRLGHPTREYRRRVDGNPKCKLRLDNHLDAIFGFYWLSS